MQENLKTTDELIDEIQGIMYSNKTDEADEGCWINGEDFHKVARIIVEHVINPLKIKYAVQSVYGDISTEAISTLERQLKDEKEKYHSIFTKMGAEIDDLRKQLNK